MAITGPNDSNAPNEYSSSPSNISSSAPTKSLLPHADLSSDDQPRKKNSLIVSVSEPSTSSVWNAMDEIHSHSVPTSPEPSGYSMVSSERIYHTSDRYPQNKNRIERRHTVGIPSEILVPLTPRPSQNLRRQKSEREVMVGTPVKEGHINYGLMYDMLTGIRISVSRCNAKPMRDLTEADFEAAHKLAFDVAGNEMTPSSEYDFKFKDYAPWVFRKIREAFHVDPADYLLSLTGKYVLSELGSPGKSGSFFYFSQDYRFIIKTIHHSEHRFMRTILESYYTHIKDNQQTLLSRIFGLHRVKLPGNKKIHFVVMGNVFPSNKDIHEVYDLKGSTVGREIDEEEARRNPRAVMKDINWMNREKKMYFGDVKRDLLVNQMEKDVAWLVANKIMDYSLLIGIHDMKLGNKKNIRDQTLAVFEGSVLETLSRANTGKRHSKSGIRKMLRDLDPVALGPSSAMLPDDSPSERRYCVFYQDQGGFQATDKDNYPVREIYYIGIIDIFTKYDAAKRAETFFKSMVASSKKISSVKPAYYGKRFLEFMKGAIEGKEPDRIRGLNKGIGSIKGMTTAAIAEEVIGTRVN